MKRFFHFIRGASYIILTSLATLFLAALVCCIVFHLRLYAVVTGSMEPVIHVGSLVAVHSEDSYGVGDIVSYQLANGTVVVHRIVESADGHYITKGDANETEDIAPVSESQVLGKVCLTIPYLGYVCISGKAKIFCVTLLIVLLIPTLLPEKRSPTASTGSA